MVVVINTKKLLRFFFFPYRRDVFALRNEARDLEGFRCLLWETLKKKADLVAALENLLVYGLCHGQKGRVEASESYFEVFIAAGDAMHDHSRLRDLLRNSQWRISLECFALAIEAKLEAEEWSSCFTAAAAAGGR